jgi:hypothetical protein
MQVEVETTRKEIERFLTILDVKRNENVHGPLWPYLKYYTQISQTPYFSVFYKSGYSFVTRVSERDFALISIFELCVPERETDNEGVLSVSGCQCFTTLSE